MSHNNPTPGDTLVPLSDERGALEILTKSVLGLWETFRRRWWLVIARCDSAANSDANNVSVLCVNGAEGGSVHRQPRVCFKPSKGTFVSQVDDGRIKSEEGKCSTDFGGWNVMVGYRRGFVMQVVVNGVKTVGQTIYALAPNRMKSESFMGDVNNPMRADGEQEHE